MFWRVACLVALLALQLSTSYVTSHVDVTSDGAGGSHLAEDHGHHGQCDRHHHHDHGHDSDHIHSDGDDDAHHGFCEHAHGEDDEVEGQCDHGHAHDDGGYLVVPDDGGPIEYDYALRLRTAVEPERTTELVMRARDSSIFLATQPSHIVALARPHGHALVFIHAPNTNSLSDSALEALTAAAVDVQRSRRSPSADLDAGSSEAGGDTKADESNATRRAELVEPHAQTGIPLVVVDARLILRDRDTWGPSISRWLTDLPALLRVGADMETVSGATLDVTAQSLEVALHGAASLSDVTAPSVEDPLRFIDGVLE